MKLSGLLARAAPDLPGVWGVARVDRHTDRLLRRVSTGDIAVLDQVDLDPGTAAALVAAKVAGVVNASPSISGRFPNLGPEILVRAGVALVDGAGPEVLRAVKDGARIRLHDGVVYAGDRELARGSAQSPESMAELMVQARSGLSILLEAFSSNTVEFMRRERHLLLDGVGVPDVAVPLRGRHVLVVAPGRHHAAELERLRHFVGEYQPIVIGVGAAADTVRGAGHPLALIVADPEDVSVDTLRCGAQLVVPTDPASHAGGLERVAGLGVPAVAFPASGNPEDLALLLADAHEAALVVAVGFQATLTEFLDRGRSGSNPSTFLTRLKMGGRVVDGAAVAALYRCRVSSGAVLLLVAAALVAVVASLAVSAAGDAVPALLTDVWQRVVSVVGRRFA